MGCGVEVRKRDYVKNNQCNSDTWRGLAEYRPYNKFRGGEATVRRRKRVLGSDPVVLYSTLPPPHFLSSKAFSHLYKIIILSHIIIFFFDLFIYFDLRSSVPRLLLRLYQK